MVYISPNKLAFIILEKFMAIKIAALQLMARDLNEAEANLKHVLSEIERVAQEYQPDLIVTPECTYPAYVLGSVAEFKASYPGDPLPQFAELARRYQIHLCLGLATPVEQDGELIIYNEAVLLGPDGTLIGRTAKSLLWHFDSQWFCAGTTYPVFETTLGKTQGKIGMLVCADGRQPEIARSLAQAGAQLILDPTCWVSYGADQRHLPNPQADFMLATRAWENGVYCVASDKVGLEQGTVLYAGRSAIIAPNGQKLVEGPSDQEAVVITEIPDLPNPVTLPSQRRPHLYTDLSLPTEELPIHQVLQEPLIPARAGLRAGLVQLGPLTESTELEKTLTPLIAQLARESVELVVLPDLSQSSLNNSLFSLVQGLSETYPVAILATGSEVTDTQQFKTARLFKDGHILGQWQQTHFTPEETAQWTAGAEIGPVITLPGGSGVRVGVMLGADGYGPETARILMLRGADLVLWPTVATLPHANNFGLAQLARTRATENRIYLLCATSLEQATSGLSNGASMIVDPNGAIIAPALPDRVMGVSSQISVAASREKLRAPSTDTVYNRRPDCYGQLTV